MKRKDTLTPIAVLLLLFVLVIALTQLFGVPLKTIFVGMVAYTLYGLLIVFYFLRFALIFIGVFAAYRILRERHGKQLTV